MRLLVQHDVESNVSSTKIPANTIGGRCRNEVIWIDAYWSRALFPVTCDCAL